MLSVVRSVVWLWWVLCEVLEASRVTGNTKGGHACTETGTARVFERESVCV